MTTFATVLFDLDGTLLDTAPDMAYSLNQLRISRGLEAIPLEIIRPVVTRGAAALLKLGFNITPADHGYANLLEECLSVYEAHATKTTNLFPGMEAVLTYLENKNIPWGIVTNKPSRFVLTILKVLQLDERSACTICGDTLKQHKPDPEPILYACELLQCAPNQSLYIGDSHVDIQASNAAGTSSLVALYGYIGQDEDPYSWGASGYIREPGEIIPFLST